MGKAQEPETVQAALRKYLEDILEDEPAVGMVPAPLDPLGASNSSTSSAQQSTMLAAASALRKQANELLVTAQKLEASAWEQIPEDSGANQRCLSRLLYFMIVSLIVYFMIVSLIVYFIIICTCICSICLCWFYVGWLSFNHEADKGMEF